MSRPSEDEHVAGWVVHAATGSLADASSGRARRTASIPGNPQLSADQIFVPDPAAPQRSWACCRRAPRTWRAKRMAKSAALATYMDDQIGSPSRRTKNPLEGEVSRATTSPEAYALRPWPSRSFGRCAEASVRGASRKHHPATSPRRRPHQTRQSNQPRQPNRSSDARPSTDCEDRPEPETPGRDSAGLPLKGLRSSPRPEGLAAATSKRVVTHTTPQIRGRRFHVKRGSGAAKSLARGLEASSARREASSARRAPFGVRERRRRPTQRPAWDRCAALSTSCA